MEEGKIAKETQTLSQAKAFWRELSVNDIKSLARVADSVHPGLPESDEVFAERVKLFPKGCLGLVEGNGNNELCGYAISHPIRHSKPPALDSLLGEIALDANTYYIHDLAILPEFRGCGFARECIEKLFAIGKGYSKGCLISVYSTEPFWSRFGFVPVQVDDDLEKKLLDYGDDAIYLECKKQG